MVPAKWVVERVTSGPGSARVQVISPTDADVAVHVTQSSLPPNQSHEQVAESLHNMLSQQPDGVFVDFNPSGHRAGLTVVTYRGLPPDHHITWVVPLEATLRIAIGCQSAPGHEDAVGEVCDQAIRPRIRSSEKAAAPTEPIPMRSVLPTYRTDNTVRNQMTAPGSGPLATDFDLMAAVAGRDARNEEIRAMLQSVIGRMGGVPPSVWGGVAAARFRDVVERWNGESMKLHAVLQGIAETLRYNEQALRGAGESHSHQIGSVATNL
jgi:uncharacterized protein YukE